MTIMVHPNASERMRILGPTFVPSYANKYMAGTHIWISWTHILSRRKGIYRRNDAFIYVKNLGWPALEINQLQTPESPYISKLNAPWRFSLVFRFLIIFPEVAVLDETGYWRTSKESRGWVPFIIIVGIVPKHTMPHLIRVCAWALRFMLLDDFVLWIYVCFSLPLWPWRRKCWIITGWEHTGLMRRIYVE